MPSDDEFAMTELDYLVIGFSIAGVAAAERLSREARVAIADYALDNASLEELLVVNPTGWSGRPVSGEDFQREALQRLDVAGVRRLLVTPASIEIADGVIVRDVAGRQIRCQGFVFAPNGSDPGLPRALNAERLFGHGVSFSGVADIAFAARRPVAVLGCGARAHQEVTRASRSVAKVYWLCSNTIESNTAARIAPSVIEVFEGATLTALEEDYRGNLAGVRFDQDGQSSEIDVVALFVAQDLVTSWSLFGNEARARKVGEKGRVAFAGIAMGLPYTDHIGLFESGVRAAERVLASTA